MEGDRDRRDICTSRKEESGREGGRELTDVQGLTSRQRGLG